MNLTQKMSSCILCIMENKTYTISDLERVTGLNRRTIHFYAKERLIPPPDGTGGGARYGEEHMLRLKLIGEMQKSHLKLSGIREALDAMSVEEMRSLADRTEESPRQVWDKAALEHWLALEDSAVSASSSSPLVVMDHDMDIVKPMSFLKIAKERQKDERQDSSSYLRNLRRAQPVREESWQRFEVSEGLELNVRSDMVRRHRQMIMKLLEELRKNIREEGGT